MLPIKKIYIDTRHSAKYSASSSDFKVDLPVNITLPLAQLFTSQILLFRCLGIPLNQVGITLYNLESTDRHIVHLNVLFLR